MINMNQGRSLAITADLAVNTKRHVKLVEKKMSICLLTWIGEVGRLIKRTLTRTSQVDVLLPARFNLESIIKGDEFVIIKVANTHSLDGEVLWTHKNRLEIQGISFEIKAKPRYTLGFITFQTRILLCVNK